MFNAVLTVAIAALLPVLNPTAEAPSPQSPAAAPQAEVAAQAPEGRRTSVVEGLDLESWSVTLEAEVAKRIVIRGDGKADLDAFLFDENDNLVAHDDDETSICFLDVMPRWTGKFKVVVANIGLEASEYTIEVVDLE